MPSSGSSALAAAVPVARAGGGGRRGGPSAGEELRNGSRRASLAMGAVMRQLQDTGGGVGTAEAAPFLTPLAPVICWEVPPITAWSFIPPHTHAHHLAVAAGLSSEDAEVLQQQNGALREALDSARQELFEVYKQVGREGCSQPPAMPCTLSPLAHTSCPRLCHAPCSPWQLADLEAAANEVVHLESRAEAAEGERDEALAQLRCATPRPQHSWAQLQQLVGEQGVQRFQAALEAHKHWPSDDLALLLAGSVLHAGAADAGAAQDEATSGSDGGGGARQQQQQALHLCDHVELGLGCLRSAVAQGVLSRADVKQVPTSSSPPFCRLHSPALHHSQHTVIRKCPPWPHLLPSCLLRLPAPTHLTQAILDCNVACLVEAADEEHTDWLCQALGRPVANAEGLVDFLLGATAQGLNLAPSFYGCMQQYRRVQRQPLGNPAHSVVLIASAKRLQALTQFPCCCAAGHQL